MKWGPDLVDFYKVGGEIISNDDGFYKTFKKGNLMGLRSHAQQLLTVNKTAERDRNFRQTFYRSQKDTESANLYEI